MGYEINYNPEDYAHATATCRSVAAQANQAGQLIRQGLLAAAACRLEAQLRSRAAGMDAWLPAGHELSRMLQEVDTHCGLREVEAEDLAGRLQLAMDNASQAERRVQAMFALLGAPDTLLDALAGARGNEWRPPRDEAERLLALLAVLANGEALPWNSPDPDGSPVQEAMVRISDVLDAQNLAPRETIAIDQVRQLAPLSLDGTTDDYYRLQDLARQEDSRILVGRTRRADREVFLVIVPGTQPGVGTRNPLDARGIIDALGHGSANYTAAVIEALEASGAGPGSEVILTGHSQGGIHAMNLAGSQELRGRFRIGTVLTLGSPIGPMTLPPEVQSLHLEDGLDPVPGLDGMRNRRGPRQITATFPGPSDPQLLEPGGFGRAHHLENYREHLAEVQRTPNDEIQPILTGLLLAPGVISLKSFRLQRRRKEPVHRPETKQHYQKLGRISPRH